MSQDVLKHLATEVGKLTTSVYATVWQYALKYGGAAVQAVGGDANTPRGGGETRKESIAGEPTGCRPCSDTPDFEPTTVQNRSVGAASR